MNYYIEVWKKFAVFSGRARRKEYWMFVLFNIIVAILLGIIDGFVTNGILIGIYNLAIIIPSIAVGVRRLHDIGRSGWSLLFVLIPFVGPFIILYFLVTDSAPGDNEYGPNPKEDNAGGAAPAADGAESLENM
ncbi:MAG: DUF805 domain-containing protein [Planctomycetota bacterium]|jgi:uncharacterized membrane protein YhaH (DUF805 family)